MNRRVSCTAGCALVLAIGGPLLLPQQGIAQRSDAARKAPAEQSNVLTLTVAGKSKQVTISDLAVMPQSRVTVHNSHTDRDEVYTGVSVQDLLSASGLPFTKDTQQAYLHAYIRAQGTDFYFVIYSAAELSPNLNTANVIVATRLNGQELGQEGLFKLVSTGDRRPARWVRNLVSLTLVALN